MDFLKALLDIFLHVDQHLVRLVADYGLWVYAILFLVIFCETGLVVTPFLPGDSLLFAAGALCTLGSTEAGGMSIAILVPLLITAAFVGDQLNYWVGHFVGPGFLEKEKIRFIKKSHLEKTQRFYEKYGGKTIVIARFIPIIRTFAPFVAGVGAMTYSKFILYNVGGALLWVLSIGLAGYFFGNIPVIRNNFSLMVIAIIIVSVMPPIIEYARHLRRRRAARPGAAL